MSQPTIDPTPILNTLGLSGPVRATPVTGGADAAIWQVEQGDADYALRLFRPEQAAMASDNFTKDAIAGVAHEHGTVTNTIWVRQSNKPDQAHFKDNVTQLLDQSPDVVFCSMPSAYLVPFLAALRASNSKLEVFAPGLAAETLPADQLEKARDLFTASQYSSDLGNPSNRSFSSQYQSRYEGSPTAFAVAAYDAAASPTSCCGLEYGHCE